MWRPTVWVFQFVYRCRCRCCVNYFACSVALASSCVRRTKIVCRKMRPHSKSPFRLGRNARSIHMHSDTPNWHSSANKRRQWRSSEIRTIAMNNTFRMGPCYLFSASVRPNYRIRWKQTDLVALNYARYTMNTEWHTTANIPIVVPYHDHFYLVAPPRMKLLIEFVNAPPFQSHLKQWRDHNVNGKEEKKRKRERVNDRKKHKMWVNVSEWKSLRKQNLLDFRWMNTITDKYN